MIKKALQLIMLPALIFISTVNCLSSEIRQSGYDYSSEFSVVKQDNAFVICDNCRHERLKDIPRNISRPLPIVIKVSGDALPQLVPQRADINIKVVQKATSAQLPVLPKTIEGQSQKKSPITAEKQPASCILAKVYFDFDSSNVSRSEKDRLMEKIEAVRAGGNIYVRGYSCSIGDKAYNARLSGRRAEAVTVILKNQGIKPVETQGRGECCPDSDIKALNRRVEITNTKEGCVE